MKAQPTEADLMRDVIAHLDNASTPQQDKREVLEALQHLVEPIDAANDLGGMGGMQAVMQALTDQALQVPTILCLLTTSA